MPTLIATLEHEDVTYHAEPATIERTMLGVEDHGIFTFVLQCAGPSWGQGAGTYFLDTVDPLADRHEYKRVATSAGFTLLMEVMKVIGVSEWEAVKGRRVLVLRESGSRFGMISGIADLDAERVIIFNTFFDEFRKRPTDRRYVDGQEAEPESSYVGDHRKPEHTPKHAKSEHVSKHAREDS